MYLKLCFTEGVINSSVVCNHARAARLFLESITNNGCQFSAFSCPAGHEAFEQATCFPKQCDDKNTGNLNKLYNISIIDQQQ